MKIRYCDKTQFFVLWRRLGAYSDDRITRAYMDLLDHYYKGYRKYHNLEHINDCLTELCVIPTQAEDHDILKLAIWYHDIVYDLNAKDNEENSAQLLKEWMTNFQLPLEKIKKATDIIIATKHNSIPDSYDAKLMLDIDIANFGDAEKFAEASKSIRREYCFVPDDVFARGRLNILQSFLDRPSIYLTEVFQKRYEKTAREYLQTAINVLEPLLNAEP